MNALASTWNEAERIAIRSQLSRILASEVFAKAVRRCRFLEFVVSEMLAGRGAMIKGYAIAVEVFNKPTDFDPTTDPIVRVEAGRLRDRLHRYYRTLGKTDPVIIDLPLGAYAPRFEFRVLEPNEPSSAAPTGNKCEPSAAVANPEPPSLAVLPFSNLSDDPRQQYFADGLTDNLITDLSKLSALTIISRRSSFAVCHSQKTTAEIAGNLNVRYVVEGSVSRDRDRLRIWANLVDVAGDSCLWAERYDRELRAIFDVQDDISRCIVENLRVTLTPLESDRLGHEGTSSILAHDMVMRGLAVYWQYTRESCAEALDYFRQAVAQDGFYAAAHAWLARAYVLQHVMNWVPDADRSLRPALIHARRAVELDDLLPLAHSVEGWALLWNGMPEAAFRAGRRACALDPNDADAHLFLAQTLCHLEQAGEGLRYIEKGMRLNPRPSTFYYYVQGFVYLALERYPDAISSLRHGTEMSPSFMPNHATLAVAYALNGEVEAGKRQLAAVEGLWPGPSWLAALHGELARRYSEARRLLGLAPGGAAANGPSTEANNITCPSRRLPEASKGSKGDAHSALPRTQPSRLDDEGQSHGIASATMPA